jgi:hypothetical protein
VVDGIHAGGSPDREQDLPAGLYREFWKEVAAIAALQRAGAVLPFGPCADVSCAGGREGESGDARGAARRGTAVAARGGPAAVGRRCRAGTCAPPRWVGVAGRGPVLRRGGLLVRGERRAGHGSPPYRRRRSSRTPPRPTDGWERRAGHRSPPYRRRRSSRPPPPPYRRRRSSRPPPPPYRRRRSSRPPPPALQTASLVAPAPPAECDAIPNR